jgi:hypothetical protein
MKNTETLMIRYMGNDAARRYVIQRGDGHFWTGEGFSSILDNAKLFTDHKTAQAACVAIQYDRHRGKPVRTFKCEMVVTVVGDEVDKLAEGDVANYVADAVRIDVETSIFGDGPAEGTYLLANVRVNTLREVEPERKTF